MQENNKIIYRILSIIINLKSMQYQSYFTKKEVRYTAGQQNTSVCETIN